MDFRERIKNNVTNIRGRRTARKIVVIESDDWGSVRVPSLQGLERAMSDGAVFSGSQYNHIDTLASEEDLTALFDLLASFRDSSGNHPVITANAVMTNPDFDKIAGSGFNEYHNELFTETLKRYPAHARSFDLWKEGISANIFRPQFHGREHLNVPLWLHALRAGYSGVRESFDEGIWSCLIKEDERKHFLAAFDYSDEAELAFVRESISEGLDIFKALFGFSSKTMISPCYVWDSDIEKTASEHGVTTLQGSYYQNYTTATRKRTGKGGVRRFMGERNEYGQCYTIRNCVFEPAQEPGRDSAARCLDEIAVAFRWHKPAIIGSHRLNYIGGHDPSSRDRGLAQLRTLLTAIIKRWPDVEFMSSDRLSELIISPK